jgi:hypothetical protein
LTTPRFPRPGPAWWLALAAASLALCLPLLLVDVPPLGDYPNHLARAFVLAHLDDPTLASAFATTFNAVYHPNWAIIPDLAIDSFMPWLLTVLPVHVAGRLLLALILTLDLLGAAACAAALHRGRTWWSLAAALLACHYAFLQGFLNFDLTLAAAMLLAAAWIRLRPGRPALAALAGIASATALFFGHLMGLVFYGLLIASFEASLLLPLPGTGRDHGARRLLRTWPLLAAAIPPAILYPLSGLHGAGGPTAWLPWRWRLMESIAAVTNYVWPLDVLTALAIAGFLAACAAAGRLRVAPGAVLALLLLALLFPLMPNDLKGTSLVAVRLAVMLGFVAILAFRPDLPRRAATWAFCAFAALFALRTAVLATAWWGYRVDVADIRTLIAPIQPNDRVTQLDIDRFDVPDYDERAPMAWRMSDGLWTESHLMALVVIERRAFWTNLFVNPDQQPLVFRPEYQALADSGRDLPAYADLVRRRAAGNPAAPNPFCRFDWIMLQGTWAEPHPETLSPDWLALRGSNRTAALYKPRCRP